MKRSVLFITILLTTSAIEFAQKMPVPVNLQVALFKKIFNYNKTLESKGIKLAIIYTDSGIKDEVVEGFKQFGMFPVPVSVNEIEKVIANYTVIYITPGCGSLNYITDKYKVFSVSGAPTLAEKGEVSVAIGIDSGRPKILVNKKKVESEGQELSLDLLKIAKIL